MRRAAGVLFAGAVSVGVLVPAASFEKIALIDSLDAARTWDVETPEGTLKVLDDAMRPHSTRVLWRDRGACLMRYPCAEEPYPECEFPIDKRRVPPKLGAFWALRLDNCGFDVFKLVFGECERRGLGQGIHTTWEENHWCNSFMGTWNMRHPQYGCRAKGGLSWAGHASLAYPEVVEHKLRMVDERLALRPQTIFLDMYRDGGWTPRLEYVPPVCARWRERYGCEPPDNPKDDRWLGLVSEYVTAYVKEFSRRCRAAGVEFVIGLPYLAKGGRGVWEHYALDWRKLAAEGVFDGIWVMSFPIDPKRPFESTEEFYAYMMTQSGKAAKMYFPLDEYNYRKEGLPTYAKYAGCTKAEAAKRLLEVARKAGGAGVVYECVDPHLYGKEVCDALKNEGFEKFERFEGFEKFERFEGFEKFEGFERFERFEGFEGLEKLCVGGAPSFSKDGRHMAFQRAVGDKMRVGVLDLKTGKTVWPETQGNACHPFFASDGSLVYAYANITNTAYQRFMLNGPQDGYGIRRWKDGVATDLTHGLWRDYQPSVSPDGKRLYFCTQRPHEGAPPLRIDVLEINGGKPKPFILPAGQPYGDASVGQPVVSPDGRMIAWAQINTTYDVWHVLVARMDDLDNVCAVSPMDMVAYAPRWSPDGKMIAFTGCREDDPRWCVYLASLETGNVTRLCEGEDPDFTADGKSIAYSDGGVIYRRALGTRAPTRLPTTNYQLTEPEKIVFATNGVPAALTDVYIPKECVWKREQTCFIRARFIWSGDTSCLQEVCRAGWLPSDCSLQLYIQKGGHPNFSIRDINWQQTYLPATRPLSGAGEHTLTGIRTKDSIYLSIDGGPAAVAPITRGVAPLDRPGKVAFAAPAFKPMDRIVSFELGTGWPTNVPKPLTLKDLMR